MDKPRDVPPGKTLQEMHRAIVSNAPGKAKQLSRDRSHIESSVRIEEGTFITKTQVRGDDTSFVLQGGPVTSRGEELAKEFLDGLRFDL